MTKKDFINSIQRLAPWSSILFKKEAGASLSEICRIVAEDCFINKQEENELTAILREQLLYLREYGEFIFDSHQEQQA